MRTSVLHVAVLAASAALFAPHAAAGERPLIWEFSRNSDTFYAARLGSRLPFGADASVGTEIRVRGPDPSRFTDPVLLWATLRTESDAFAAAKRTTRLDLRTEGATGKRTISVNNVFSGYIGGLDTEFVQNVALDHELWNTQELHVRSAHSIRLSAFRTRTVVIARAARVNDEAWRTSVGVEQPLGTGVRFSATVEDHGEDRWKGFFRARYSHSW